MYTISTDCRKEVNNNFNILFSDARNKMLNNIRMGNKIQQIRKERGLTLQQLAEKVGTSHQQISFLEKGERKLTVDWLVRLARALHCSPGELMYDTGAPPTPIVPLVGYVGDNESIHPFNDDDDEETEVPMPMISRTDIDPDELVAIKVRGSSMRPYIKEGSTMFYMRRYDGVPKEYYTDLCAVMCEDGRSYVKEVHKGSRPGLYTLISYNPTNPPMVDVPLKWATKIVSFELPK